MNEEDIKRMAEEAEKKAGTGANPPQEPPGNQMHPIKIERAITEFDELPDLPPELICGLMRKGGKLMVSGPSKAGKSFLLIELACAIATGGYWCGFRCMQGRVLYINLEIQRPQFMHRVAKVVERRDCDKAAIGDNFDIANLRGASEDIASLAEKLTDAVRPGVYELAIIDPVYKVQKGAENDADSISRFCDGLDTLAESLGCSVAYVHHHPKSDQSNKNAANRASGSGVFARDLDALVDMMELEPNEDAIAAERLAHMEGVPFRLEFVARDFKSPEPREIWFRYPIHEVDDTDTLAACKVRKQGGKSGFHEGESNRKKREIEDKLDEFMGALNEVDRKEFLKQMKIDERTLKKHLENSERFEMESGSNYSVLRRKDPQDSLA